MIQVFIIDDHQIVINGLRQAVEKQDDIEIAGEALTAAEGLNWLQAHTADVILLDIHLPDRDGMEVCKVLTKKYPKLKIIGLTTFGQVSFITQMLQNGASGYLFKNTSEEELTEAIRTVHQGEQYLSKEVNDKLIAKAMKRKSASSTFIPKLTRREKEVLELIMEEHTNQEIADTLFLSVSTVETHRMNLCAKLGARNTAGLVKNAIKFGLI